MKSFSNTLNLGRNFFTIFSKLFLIISTLIFLLLQIHSVRSEEITKAHGISTFGDLKYPVDFKHLDYVNPIAPKGGEFSTWAFGTFDSLSPYILKGNSARGATLFFESLMTGTADEPDSMYYWHRQLNIQKIDNGLFLISTQRQSFQTAPR